jgi:uncharacterized Zn finger protein
MLQTIKCPTCSNRMTLFSSVVSVAGLPELCTYKCEKCGVRKTMTEIVRSGAKVLIFPDRRRQARQQRP